MKLVMFFITMVFVFMFIACAKPAPPEEVVHAKAVGNVGPFALKLSPEKAGPSANAFSAEIDQAEGAVDFYSSATASVQYLVFESFSAKVSGCSARAVKVTPLWYESEVSAQPQVLASGNTMHSTVGKRGKLRVVFTGMGGCTNLDFSMVVRRLDIGTLQTQIEPRLHGEWASSAVSNLTTVLDFYSDQMEWSESAGTGDTCDTYFSPTNALEAAGGWLVSGGGSLICHYQFGAVDSRQMTLNCYGSNVFGCSMPKNLSFDKH